MKFNIGDRIILVPTSSGYQQPPYGVIVYSDEYPNNKLNSKVGSEVYRVQFYYKDEPIQRFLHYRSTHLELDELYYKQLHRDEQLKKIL